MIASEYLLLGALILAGVGIGIGEVKDTIQDTAKELASEQRQLLKATKQKQLEQVVDQHQLAP